MDACEFNSTVDAYHDGELDAAAAERFEAHVANCPSCQAELRAVRAMSQLMQTRMPATPEMPARAMARLHDEVNRVMERSLLRLAGSFAAIAATVLIAATVGLMTLSSQRGGGGGAVAAPQAWESSAFVGQSTDTSAQSTSDGAFEPEMIVMDLSRKAVP
jgi:anti-sigma factor RsiW